MFSQACIIPSVGWGGGWGCMAQVEGHVWQGGHAWQWGVCMVEGGVCGRGVHGRRACMAGGHVCRRHGH